MSQGIYKHKSTTKVDHRLLIHDITWTVLLDIVQDPDTGISKIVDIYEILKATNHTGQAINKNMTNTKTRNSKLIIQKIKYYRDLGI